MHVVNLFVEFLVKTAEQMRYNNGGKVCHFHKIMEKKLGNDGIRMNAIPSFGDDDDEDFHNFDRRTNKDGLLKQSCLQNIATTARDRAISAGSEREALDGSGKRSSDVSVNGLSINVDEIQEDSLFQNIPEPYEMEKDSFQRISITERLPNDIEDVENKKVCQSILDCLELRKKWVQFNEQACVFAVWLIELNDVGGL